MPEFSQRAHTKCQSQGAMAGHGHLLVHPRNLIPTTSPQIHTEERYREEKEEYKEDQGREGKSF